MNRFRFATYKTLIQLIHKKKILRRDAHKKKKIVDLASFLRLLMLKNEEKVQLFFYDFPRDCLRPELSSAAELLPCDNK